MASYISFDNENLWYPLISSLSMIQWFHIFEPIKDMSNMISRCVLYDLTDFQVFCCHASYFFISDCPHLFPTHCLHNSVAFATFWSMGTVPVCKVFWQMKYFTWTASVNILRATSIGLGNLFDFYYLHFFLFMFFMVILQLVIHSLLPWRPSQVTKNGPMLIYKMHNLM